MARRTRVSVTYMSGPLDGKTLHWDVPPTDPDEISLTIGRREGCDILLDYDSQVSRTHARVVYDSKQDMFYLEDTASRNGTFLGQERIRSRTPLTPGDLFRVGRTWMRIDPLAPISEEFEFEDEDLPF